MPSLKKKTQEEDDPLRRRQKKALEQSQAQAHAPGGRDETFNLPLRKDPTKDRLDYSRFAGIGDECREERKKTGDITWDELKADEKKEIFAAQEYYENQLDKKRDEEDSWKRQLREKPSDLSWVQGRHFTSYEAFCVGRVEGTFKKTGNEAYQKGEYDKARMDWDAGVQMLLALGDPPPEAKALICVLRNNLAQLACKQANWPEVKALTDKVIDSDPTNEKGLYRRAQAYYGFSIWDKAEKDLELLVKHHPKNKDGSMMLQTVRHKLGKDKKTFGGKAVSDICAGLEELCPDGTVRKLRIEDYGEGNPDEKPTWLKPEWLQKGSKEKVVVTTQMIIWSVGGEELYNSKEYRPFPETKQARDELKEYMDMVNFLDQEAKKAPRLVGDFYKKVKKRPVRWYINDPGMYTGFDLAVQTMKIGERALFEVDQPKLAPSVEKFYDKVVGHHSGIAGLPQLIYHIEEERLSILEDEMTERDLELETKTQRGVRVELQLLGVIPFRDLSPAGDGAHLHGVLHPGIPEAGALKRGNYVRGSFYINRPFDGSLLVQNAFVEWRLGEDEGKYDKQGENKEPIRPDGGAFVPKCIGDAILKVDWVELFYGCLVEVRLREGPELHEIAPQLGPQFEASRREAHKKGKKGGAMVSILVQIFPPEWGAPADASNGTTIAEDLMDENIPQDMEIE